MRLTAMRKASVRRQARIGQRHHLIAQVALQLLHVGAVDSPADDAGTDANVRFAPRVGGDLGRGSCCARLQPDSPECFVHDLPLLPLRRQLGPALFGNAIVLGAGGHCRRRRHLAVT